jgi:hypothetical protein
MSSGHLDASLHPDQDEVLELHGSSGDGSADIGFALLNDAEDGELQAVEAAEEEDIPHHTEPEVKVEEAVDEPQEVVDSSNDDYGSNVDSDSHDDDA